MPQPRSIFGSRRTTAALVMITGLLMVGCQGDPGAPGSPTPVVSTSADTSPSPSQAPTITAPTTPEPSPASSDGPAANIPVPEKPPLADENSVEGLEAFTEYWFELFSYGYITNDWAEFLEITDTGCATCGNIVGEVEAQFESGGWISGGDATLVSFMSLFELNTEGSVNSFSEVAQTSISYFDETGELAGGSPTVDATVYTTIALYENSQWIMLDFGSPEGT
ncbi:DUF6318 family protein [Arthrobacter sp. TB 23]|uniref:DUF6318 family protein n=1 Tax=Arthrobacter sp. TB 23 TaxID=494419 RepID=UPI0012E99D10|nr:DUF6318 family protein [Arthrobacter sp. TB 23]